jgi:thiol reductant ABC exporter CydD subunit
LTTPAGPRRAFDKRLLRFGRPVHAYLTAAVALGVGTAALTIGQALLLGWIIAEVFHGSGLGDVTPQLTGLLVIAVLRGLIVWATEAIAYRSAAATKSSLRRALLRRVVANRGTGSDPGAVVAAAGRGIEALDPYFARYLPQVVLALVVPLLVLMVVLAIDPWSALIIGATLPLIPVFAALTGTATRSRMSQRWQAFSDLSSGFVESVRSLPTLKVFGRSREAVARFGRLADAHRVETMGTLRIAFLSALALELAATISVAVVAVAVGLRVLGAGLELQPALTVLILAPEAYLPLRRLAAEFHSAAEGVEAAGRMLDEIEAPIEAPRSGSRAAPNHPGITIHEVRIEYPGSATPALAGVSLDVAAGDYLAVTGPTGAGKSTLLSVLMGFSHPVAGSVTIDGAPLHDFDGTDWLQRIAWLPQSPHLFAGSVADNVRFGSPDASDDLIDRALSEAGAGFVTDLSEGAATMLGEYGAGLSAGERSRVALARALIRRAPILLLDEPTAHLDPITELKVLDTLDSLRGTCTIVIASHRQAVASRADRVVRFESGRMMNAGSS